MSNATASEIYESARNIIVNSALGIALGMTEDTGILDAATSIGNVVNNGTVNKTFTPSTSVQTYTIPKGWHNGSGKVTINAATAQVAVTSAILAGLTDNETWNAKTLNLSCTVGHIYVAAMAGDPGNYQNFAITGGTILSNLTTGDTPPSGSKFARLVLFKATSTTVTIDWGATNANAIVAALN